MGKLYVVLVLCAIVALALFGVLLPMLFSAKSTEAVLVGCLIVIILPVVVYGIFSMFKGKSDA